MGFDILLFTCNLGTRKRRVKNPFTGEWMTDFDDPGLTAGERAAVAKLLHALKSEGPDEDGTYQLSFRDGGEADLYAPGLADGSKCDGCSVGTHNLTAEVARFLFQLSRRGNMVVMPVAEGACALVTSEDQRGRVAARYPDAKVVRSAHALAQELRPGFMSWCQYRDWVVGDEA